MKWKGEEDFKSMIKECQKCSKEILCNDTEKNTNIYRIGKPGLESFNLDIHRLQGLFHIHTILGSPLFNTP